MEKRIAVITPSKLTFNRFMYNILNGDTGFTHISNIEDIRGRVFTGTISLYDCQKIEDYYHVLNLVKSRIKKTNYD